MTQPVDPNERPWLQLSALCDGEADAGEAQASFDAWRDEPALRERWHAYQWIGDVMRSDDLASDAGHDQSFLLGLIENEEETIQLIVAALERVDGKGEVPYGQCVACAEENNAEAEKAKVAKPVKPVKGAKPVKPAKVAKKPAKQDKLEPWIPKDRLEYIPWARYCVRHQEDEERNRNIA